MKNAYYSFLTAFVFSLLALSTSYAQLSETYVNGIGSETIRQEAFTLIITPVGGALLDISIDKNPYANTSIRLRDDQKTTIYTAHSRSDNPLFARRLDLRELDNGTYWLDVWVDKKHVVRRLQLTSVNGEYQAVILP
ncbi:hypothetical protein [Fibrella aquatilis]|uniref:Uncharacterized protein n=1 Tax=Fibrella aquatilis TaxID=2817059 RepID=A0A939G7Q9_9BACT|nr:hypothetical protein [Fibrella aquatilis]MBO0933421.1 hypothetical protein [Fibrella aquatilis]